MKLIPEWRQVLWRAWSMRLWLIAVTCSFAAQLLSNLDGWVVYGHLVTVDGRLVMWLALAGFAFTVAYGPARMVHQPKMHKPKETEDARP